MKLMNLSIKQLKVVFAQLGGKMRYINKDKRLKSVWLEAVENLLMDTKLTKAPKPKTSKPTPTNVKENFEIYVSKAACKRILSQRINAKTITVSNVKLINKSVLVCGKINRKTFSTFIGLESFINDFRRLREEGAKEVQLTIFDIFSNDGEIKANALAQSVSRDAIQHKTTLSECSCEDFAYHNDILTNFKCKHILALEYACQDVQTHMEMLKSENHELPEWLMRKEELLYQ